MVTETKRSFLLSIRLDYASTNTTFGEIKDSNEKVKGGPGSSGFKHPNGGEGGEL